MSTSKTDKHNVTKVEKHGYVHFTCPEQPALEMRSFQIPSKCPVCRTIAPIKMTA